MKVANPIIDSKLKEVKAAQQMQKLECENFLKERAY